MKKLNKKTIAIIEAGSWYGVVAILAAYILVSFSILPPYNWIPVTLNITGSITMLIDAAKDGNQQPVVINIVWIIIAVLTVLRIF